MPHDPIGVPIPQPKVLDYAEHTVSIDFWKRQLSDALRDRNMGKAQMCIHNIRQHCDQLDYWIINQTAARAVQV